MQEWLFHVFKIVGRRILIIDILGKAVIVPYQKNRPSDKHLWKRKRRFECVITY